MVGEKGLMMPKRDRSEDREYDLTSLRAAHHGYVVHRDYAAHFFRWGWVSRKFVDPSKTVLDIGCGPDGALVKVLAHKMANGLPRHYTGVDMNRLDKMPNCKWATFIGKFNFAERWEELQMCPVCRDANGLLLRAGKRPRCPMCHDDAVRSFDLITCLEVVEHMRMSSVRKLLRGARALLAPGGRMILSTPVFDGHMAKNHINEMTIPQLQKELESAGWLVERRFGTFMSDQDRRKVCTPAENELVDRLKDYYSTDVTACFLAPLYPDASRNCIWLCSNIYEEDPLA